MKTQTSCSPRHRLTDSLPRLMVKVPTSRPHLPALRHVPGPQVLPLLPLSPFWPPTDCLSSRSLPNPAGPQAFLLPWSLPPAPKDALPVPRAGTAQISADTVCPFVSSMGTAAACGPCESRPERTVDAHPLETSRPHFTAPTVPGAASSMAHVRHLQDSWKRWALRLFNLNLQHSPHRLD